QDDTEYGLKPMNCANHAHVFDTSSHSYRDLPIRLSEFGTCYRNEQSGELSGMLRVRGFTQDDGHAFIRPDQIEREIRDTLGVVKAIYEDFGFEIGYKLETQGDNAVGSDEMWDDATDSLKAALAGEGLEYEIEQGEAAFYGPKIAIDAEDAIGRQWTVGTVQLDFNIPRRLELTYVGEDNDEHYPVMVHRALLGSFERFMGVLIEHFKGQFPFWLAPEQVRILPVSDDALGYAHRVKNELGEFRVEVEDRGWTVGRKIRQAHDDRVPYMIVVGSDEAESGTLSVRDRFEREADDVDPDAFREHLAAEYESKRLEPDFLDA
ncbi:MAG: threonine--tRNA ligase, partial [Halolamina sp.]